MNNILTETILALAMCTGVSASAQEAPSPTTPTYAPRTTLPYIPGQSYQPELQSLIKTCWTDQLKNWSAATTPSPDPLAISIKGSQLYRACRKTVHVSEDSRRLINPIGPCEGKGVLPMPPTDQQPVGYYTEPAVAGVPPHIDRDDIPQACQSGASGATTLNWIRVHLRGGDYGNDPDPNFYVLRPEDGHFVTIRSELSARDSKTEMTIDEQLRQMQIDRPQGSPPNALVALIYKRGDKYSLLPLNYSAGGSPQVEMPWSPAMNSGLSVAYDAGADKYLLYVPSVTFLTPPWNGALPSWEQFYVWWFDAKKETIKRQLLPQGPWVADAKRDRELSRDAKNFSCGTDCYRHYDIKTDSGKLFVTITGRLSALSEDVMGTYSLSEGDNKWGKIKEGKPEQQ